VLNKAHLHLLPICKVNGFPVGHTRRLSSCYCCLVH